MSYEFAKATRILATSCCCYGKPLVDADSVEMGIGPVCRKKYMKPEPGADDAALAFTVLAQSGVPTDIIEATAARETAREQANLLVYYASANVRDREAVLSVTTALRALGYVQVAEKLERDRNAIRIEVVGEKLHVFTPYSGLFNAMTAKAGRKAVYIPGKTKARFRCWSFPAQARRTVWTALSRAFGGEKGYGPRGAFSIPEVA